VTIRDVLITLFTLIGAGVAAVIVFDLVRYLMGRETISAFMRADMRWFYRPTIVIVLLLFALFLHLKLRST
jgi:hypothetical protein